MEPRVRKVFPGANTAYGFYSFYDQIIEPDAKRIYVIKGGPGVGKSTFMRRIADELLKLGHDVEFLCCSSDNDSYDGVRFPGLDVALIDGTAPHVVDPKNPGAVDTIIHLGDYWNQQGIMQHKDKVLEVNRETSWLFARAYDYLAISKRALDMLETYSSVALRIRDLDRQAELLIEDAIGDKSCDTPGKARHMFASAISPNGLVNYLDTLLDAMPVRYLISGRHGTGRTTLVSRLADAALRRGFFVECFHCSLDPNKIEHVIIPELGVAATTYSWPHEVTPRAGDVFIDTTAFMDTTKLRKYKGEMEEAENFYRRALHTGQGFIAQAKRTHDVMEQYYTPYMDFDAIAAVRAKTLEDILELGGVKG